MVLVAYETLYAEEKFSGLEDIPTERSWYKTQNLKAQSISERWNIVKWPDLYIIEVSERKKA